MDDKKSFLIITNELPINNTGGANIRNFFFIKELSKYYNVTLLSFVGKKDKAQSLSDLENICEVIIIPSFFGSYLFKIFLLRRNLKKILLKRNFNYIQVEHSEFGDVLNGVKTDSMKILDFHNVDSYAIGLDKNIFDMHVCCSVYEKEKLNNLRYKNIIVVPNGVDVEYFHFDKNTDKQKSILFIGRLKYRPNIEGIKYFIKEIFPLLGINIKLNIIGEYDDKDFINERKIKNVNFLGFVDDIRPYFNNSIFICPILHGNGTRLKILTAFANGAPVVSTSKGAEGVDYVDEENILIADSPILFKDKILKLINEPVFLEKNIQNARKLAEEQYDWKIIMENYKNELNKL
ncbi:MAG: glycosyltransferase family 4 protein [bacterium]